MTRLDVTFRHLVPSPVKGQYGKVDQARASQHFQVVGSFLLVIDAREAADLLTIQFATMKVPKLTKTTLVNTEVHRFIQYIHQLLRQEAFDESILGNIGNMIDTETISLLQFIFSPTETRRRHRSLPI